MQFVILPQLILSYKISNWHVKSDMDNRFKIGSHWTIVKAKEKLFDIYRQYFGQFAIPRESDHENDMKLRVFQIGV